MSGQYMCLCLDSYVFFALHVSVYLDTRGLYLDSTCVYVQIVMCSAYMQVWKSLEAGHWLNEEAFEMVTEFPAAQASTYP